MQGLLKILYKGNYIKISVKDTGHGMKQRIISSIFEPYFTTKEKGKGTGLGLSVVHGIVKRHKGEIKVYSEPQKRSTFIIYLPVIHENIKVKKIMKIRFLGGMNIFCLWMMNRPW